MLKIWKKKFFFNNFSESLRIYPPGLWSTKCCTQPYEVRNKNGEIFQIQRGESIIIPIYALHHDPLYYDEPEKFMPERFLYKRGSVKSYKDQGLYLGFGDGPRTCLGNKKLIVLNLDYIKYCLSQAIKFRYTVKT